MIFTGSYWYYGVIQIAVFAAIVAIACLVAGRNRMFDAVVVWVIGAYLLCYKLNEYGPFKAMPIDLSAMSYFLFGVAAFVPLRPLKSAAAFSAMLSGIIYVATMTFFPETHIASLNSSDKFFLINMAMCNHNLLLLGSIFMTAQLEVKREDVVCLVGWFGFFFAYLNLLVTAYGVSYKNSSIIGIIDGSLVAGVLGMDVTPAFGAVYYTVCLFVFGALVALFILLNRFLTRRYRKFLPPLVRRADIFA